MKKFVLYCEGESDDFKTETFLDSSNTTNQDVIKLLGLIRDSMIRDQVKNKELMK